MAENFAYKMFTRNDLYSKDEGAAVLAQAVEQWLSVRAGWVRIPGQTVFFGSDCHSILAGRWVFFYQRGHKTSNTSILLSGFRLEIVNQ